MHKPLLKSAVLKYFTTESQEKPKEIFEKVHFPMDRIRVELCREGTHGEFADEQDIARWVLDVDGGAPNNRIFSVVGETGSGKSELCQYLQYEAGRNPQHVPILISRSTTKLAQIIRLLNEHAGLRDDGDITEVTDLNEAHIVSLSVAYVMRVTLTKQFRNRYTDSQLRELERLFERDAFKALIARSFQEYRAQVQELGKERELNLLNRKEFDLLFGNAAPWMHLDSAYVACRDQIHESIKAQIQVGDMSGRLHRISERYRAGGKRPLLIMEDLTSFGFMKEELLDFLFQLNSGNFDVVMGWTTGFESENLGSIFRTQGDGFTYMRERLRGRFAMTDAQRSSWFLERNHVGMMARYIHAARTESGIVRPANDLYPVNAAFVSNLYNRLIDDNRQSKKTPRLLLTAMQAVLSRPDEPWVTANNLVGQLVAAKPLPAILFDLEEQYPNEVRFLEWYGRPTDGKVSRKEAEALGIKLPAALADFLTEDEPEKVIVKSEPREHERETAGSNDSPDNEQDGATEADTSDRSERTGAGAREVQTTGKTLEKVRSEPEKKPADPLEKQKLDVQQWLQGREFNLRRTAEKGLGVLLSVYGEVSGLGYPRRDAPYVLNYEKMKLHAVFEGTADRPEPFPTVFVPRNRSAREHVLTALIVGEIGAASRARETAEAAVLKDPDLVQWLGQLYDAYRAAQRQYLENRLAMSVERFVYHLYVTVVGLTTGETGSDLQIFIRFDPHQEPVALKLACLHGAPEVKELLKYRRTITDLFRSFFFVNPTTLNLPLLAQVREGYSHAAFGKTVAAVAREKIDEGFWLTVNDAEASKKDETVLLSHLFTQCVSLDGRLKSAREEFGVDREQLREMELRALASDLTDNELRANLPRIEGLLSAMKRAKDQDWTLLVDPATLDFSGVATDLAEVAAASAAAHDVFSMVRAYRLYEKVCELREIRVLRSLRQLLTQLDDDIRRVEAEVSDKEFEARRDPAVADCRKQYDRLVATVKEVGA